MMFDDMMREYDMDIPKQDVEFIKALIAGDQTRCRSVRNRVFMLLKPSHTRLTFRNEKSFLFEIVANKRNGIDVDK